MKYYVDPQLELLVCDEADIVRCSLNAEDNGDDMKGSFNDLVNNND